MAYITRPGANLWMDHIDLTPPWNTAPETLVFCHGVGTNSDTWHDWLDALATSFKLVWFDTRGFGRSPVTDPKRAWSFDDLADDILAVVDKAGGGPFHLVGESLGGTISLFLALRDPGKVKTLTLASTGFRGASLGRVNSWRETIKNDGMAIWSEQMMKARFVDGAVDKARWNWFHRVQAGTEAKSLLDAADLLLAVDLEDRLAGLKPPLQLLAGDSSPFINLEHTMALRDAVPNSRVRVFPNARHGIVFSHGKECARQTRRFINEHRD